MSSLTALESSISAVVHTALEQQRIVGAIIAILHRGEIVYRAAHGLADREAGTAMRVDTPQRLASLTKPIVAATALHLIERDQLALDAPVTRYLPDFRPQLADGAVPEITVRHLLTHTSGLGYKFSDPRGPYAELAVSDGLDLVSGLTLDENLRRLARAPLYFAPGTAWRYSLGLDVIGRVIEVVTGESLADAVRARITGPLDMASTAFVAAPDTPLATPYANASPAPARMVGTYRNGMNDGGADFTPDRAFDRTAYPSGGAGMVGTLDDFVRFLEALRRGGAPVLAEATLAHALTNQIGDVQTWRGPGWGFGLLGATLVEPARAGVPGLVGATEWGGAYGHAWRLDRAAELTIVSLTNTSFEGMNGQFPADVKAAAYRALVG